MILWAKLMMTTLFSASTAHLHSDAGHNIYKVFWNVIQEKTLTIPSGNSITQTQILLLYPKLYSSHYIFNIYFLAARCQLHTVSVWRRTRWLRLARRMGWKLFVRGMKAVVGTMLPGEVVSPSPYQPLIRCVITQYNMGCASSGSKNTLAKVNSFFF